MEINCFEPSDLLIFTGKYLFHNIMKSIIWFYIVSVLHKLGYKSQSVEQYATAWTAVFDFRKKQDFSLLHGDQPGSGTHPASYPMGTGDDFPGSKAIGA
jgi:hypothetical protein